MALTSDEHGSAREQALGFLADEGGSAAVEFIVLIPVYLLLLTGLFMFTNLALIRQSLVAASRFQAWAPDEPGSYANFEQAFFGPYRGSYGARTRTKRPVTVAAGAVRPDDFTLGSNRARALAAHVVDNGGDRPLWRVEAQSAYTYTGLVVFGAAGITQRTQSVVLLPREHTRAEFVDGEAEHPMIEWDTGAGKARSAYFDPSATENIPLSPLYDGGQGEFTRTSDLNPGVWHWWSRIGGSDQTENDYYYPKPKG